MTAAASSFHTTRWTLVLRSQGGGEEARLALSELCSLYYDPVLRFARHWCGDVSRAEDLAHGFFEELLARESPGAADPSRGRFRSYLLAAAKHYFSRQKEKDGASKRGGGIEFVPLDPASPPVVPAGWEEDFDRSWAFAVIRQAHEALRLEMEAAGRGRHFEILQPWLDGGNPGDSSVAATELGLSPNAFKVTVHRLRERFREKVRSAISATLDDPSDLPSEFRHLVEALVRHG